MSETMKTEQQSRDERKKSNRSPPYALFNLLVIVVAIIYGIYYQMYINKEGQEPGAVKLVQSSEDELEKIRLFTADELKLFDGTGDSKLLYLSILGEIFDVTRGEKHYGKGNTYHAFVAKDASRAFVTGEFEDNKSVKTGLDHVLSLAPGELVSLKKWRDFYAENYDFVGRLIGRFYEETGEPTEYFWQIDRKIEFGIKQIEEEKSFSQEFPPCNVEYKPESGTRFWCTTQSGGIERDWAGYPIQYFNQDTKSFSCVCMLKENFDLPQLRQYDNCDDATHSCSVQTNDEQNDD